MKNITNPLKNMEFIPQEQMLIDAWLYLVSHYPDASYKIGEPISFEGNITIRCEVTVNGETRQSCTGITCSYPIASDIVFAQNHALIKSIAMFPVGMEVENNDLPF